MGTQEGAVADPFVAHRGLLFTVAYELLGSAADAEDVLQESWLRWSDVECAEVRDPRAYLVRIVTRQSLNHLRTLSRRREDYVGEWLPEPLLTSRDVADDVELAESLSIATLTVLETLGPAERAVFVLREVFDLPYDEIADAADKTPALMDVLAPDVVAIADGGGKVRGAARRPVVGAEKIAAYLAGGLRRYDLRPVAARTLVNGAPAMRIEVAGALAAVVSLTIEDGRVTRIYSVANPDKLERLDAEAELAR
ncbi:sigma-70 family RNA polymerase sigma factor [Agromyces sp. SYSU T0242]|uniref:sigma-70 family RNA polymerase sigma factor n=1 Tax=Agromyces litoreus TaxID=3158561 RepID=UPI003391CD15